MSDLTNKPKQGKQEPGFSDRQLYQFLPAVLEVTETPPNKVSRWVAWSIIILFLSALLWAYLGKVDIVVVGQGQLITSGKSKLVQSTKAGVIESIHVIEGQQVQQGDLLVQLNSDLSENQKTQLEQRVYGLKQLITLETLLVAELEGADVDRLQRDDGSLTLEQSSLSVLNQKVLQERKQEQSFKLSQLQQAISTLQQQLASASDKESHLKQKIPWLEQEVKLLEKIKRTQTSSSAETQSQTELNLVRIQQTLAETQSQLSQLTNEAKQMATLIERRQNEIAQFTSKSRLAAYQTISQLEARLSESELQLASMLQLSAAERVTAPYDGTVEQIAVNTVGGYVSPGQVLMKLVPNNEVLQAEVVFQNKDIGFVKPGMPMELKVDSFRFTKYGLIEGEIATVSFDAIKQENAGAVFNSRIHLIENNIQMKGEAVELKSGMSVVAEAKVGKRRVIDFLLSPVKKTVLESVREQ